MTHDQRNLELAREEAEKSLDAGGVPIGACLADQDGNLLSKGHNERVQHGNPIAHAEITTLREAGRQTSYARTTLYTTLSPCVMCRGAIKLFRIPRVVVGEATTYRGDLRDLEEAGIEVILMNDTKCQDLMKAFQKTHPDIWNEDIGISPSASQA